jgi:dienelactone hydrolase
MTDHPLLIPTSEGPVGAIVSEPPGDALAALVLFPGYGRPARSGFNSFWTRMARELAERGLVVLRADYSREGETLPIGEGGGGQVWKTDLDQSLFGQVLPWFRDRLDGLDLLLAGSCSGARGTIEIAARLPDLVDRTFLIVPHIRVLKGAGRGRGDGADGEPVDPDAVDPGIVECLRANLERAPSWILVGERDTPDIPRLQQLLGPTAFDLEVEVVPGAALHLLDRPDIQEQVRRWLTARIEQALPSATPGSPPPRARAPG